MDSDSDSYWNVSGDGEDSIEVEPSLDRLLMEQELVCRKVRLRTELIEELINIAIAIVTAGEKKLTMKKDRMHEECSNDGIHEEYDDESQPGSIFWTVSVVT